MFACIRQHMRCVRSPGAPAPIAVAGLLAALALGPPALAAVPSTPDAGASIAAAKPGAVAGSVDAGGYQTCGVNTTGTVTCWGSNTNGQASPLSGTYIAVSAGRSHTCGLKTNGKVACWGLNSSGQAPEVFGGTFTAITAGGTHTCVLRTAGTVACFGSTANGRTTQRRPEVTVYCRRAARGKP